MSAALAGAGAFATPILITGALLMLYNFVRFGGPLETGYHFDSGEGFTTPFLIGFWGLVFSPYRGVFWHTPLFVASVAAFVFAGGAAGRSGYDRLRTYPCTGRSPGGCISSLLARTQPG